ncbi:hypothetical protein [Kribbella deserti]|uniref:Uncharacterized protein n=1 Tax=Kribbella deserti TaxID=1926257 RepID=A0ABV6QTI8_9ACTN
MDGEVAEGALDPLGVDRVGEAWVRLQGVLEHGQFAEVERAVQQ